MLSPLLAAPAAGPVLRPVEREEREGGQEDDAVKAAIQTRTRRNFSIIQADMVKVPWMQEDSLDSLTPAVEDSHRPNEQPGQEGETKDEQQRVGVRHSIKFLILKLGRCHGHGAPLHHEAGGAGEDEEEEPRREALPVPHHPARPNLRSAEHNNVVRINVHTLRTLASPRDPLASEKEKLRKKIVRLGTPSRDISFSAPALACQGNRA